MQKKKEEEKKGSELTSQIMYQTESYIHPIENLPADVYWKALEADEQLRLRDMKAAKTCHDTLQHLRKEYLVKLYATIGEHNLQAYHKDQKKRITSMQDARHKCPPTFEGNIELEEIRKKTMEKSTEFFNQLGVDLSEVASLQREYQDKVLAAFSETIWKGEETSVTPPEKNQTYRPPYSGWGWWYSWEKTDVARVASPAHSRWLNHHTGEVGNYTFIRVNDSGEADHAYILYRTAVRQWHRTTRIGQLLIRVNFETIDDPYGGRIVNEPGRSSIDLTQDVQVYARTVYPSPIVGATAHGRFIGDPYNAGGGPYRDTNRDTHSWARDWNSGGTVHLRIGEVFTEGVWVLVEVGIETFNHFLANDCSVTSYQTLRYLIREIGMSST